MNKDELQEVARIAMRMCPWCCCELNHAEKACRKCGGRKWKGFTETTSRVKRMQLKRRVFRHYGEKCSCCGEDHPMMLSIDHIFGGGNAHLSLIKELGYSSLYSWLELNNFPIGFATLCFSCNMAKHQNGGVCPHKGPGADPDQDREALKVFRSIVEKELHENITKSKRKQVNYKSFEKWVVHSLLIEPRSIRVLRECMRPEDEIHFGQTEIYGAIKELCLKKKVRIEVVSEDWLDVVYGLSENQKLLEKSDMLFRPNGQVFFDAIHAIFKGLKR